MRYYPFDIGKAVREMFPEQTKSPLHILIWTLIYLVDIAIVFWIAHILGFNIFTANNRKVLFLYLLIALIPFGIEIFVYDKIRGHR